MSRSHKKAIITISKKREDNANSVVRRKVKETLAKMDYKNPEPEDEFIIESDIDEFGKDEYGTKMGMEFES